MKIEMKQWEIERVKEIVGKVLDFWAYKYIEMSSDDTGGATLSMSTVTFLEQLERELKSY